MRFSLIAIIATSAGFAALPATAADNGIYLGASLGQGGVQADQVVSGFDFDATSLGFKVIGGWRFIDWLAVEANYVDLGTGDDNVQGVKVESDVSGISASVVGFLPVGPVDLFARVGGINWDADLDVSGVAGKLSDDGTDLTYGIGAQFRVWSLSIRGEYEVFDIEGADVDLISVGVTWTFL
jgi:OOP family OmpA-OmpF porin